MKRTHIIYIPGLGDRYDPFRRLALSTWKLWGVSTEYVAIGWYDGGSFTSKYQLVEKAVHRARKDNARIVLVGESAGATLVLHVGENEAGIDRIITLCGVARRQTPISNYLRRMAPALDAAVDTAPSHTKTDVHSIRAIIDGVVRARYSIAPGATPHVVWTIGHFFTIVLCLTLFAPYVVRIAKKS